MADYYKQSLELLRSILLENQYNFWAKWMTEDIESWEENQKHRTSSKGLRRNGFV